jgi:acetolactate synthase regulatory subunit
MGKEIKMKSQNNMDLLLLQLEELTDPKSIYFNQEVFDEKEKIKEDILNGRITID